jgi:flagellar protein FliO/FliZ
MIVRRYLFATALAVLIGAQPSVALAAPASAHGTPSPAPQRAAGLLMSEPTVNPRDIGTSTVAVRSRDTLASDHASTTRHRATRHASATAARVAHAHKHSEFKAESTPLGLGTLKPTTHVNSGGGSSIIRTLLGLLAVIGSIYGVAWVLRRIKRSREGQPTGNGLSSVATLPLGAGRSLHLVRAGSDVILVGASEHGVTPIRAYTEDEALANGVLSPGNGGSVLEDAAPAFVAATTPPARAPIVHTPAGANRGEWQGLGAPATPAPRLLESLRRLTVRS